MRPSASSARPVHGSHGPSGRLAVPDVVLALPLVDDSAPRAYPQRSVGRREQLVGPVAHVVERILAKGPAVEGPNVQRQPFGRAEPRVSVGAAREERGTPQFAR